MFIPQGSSLSFAQMMGLAPSMRICTIPTTGLIPSRTLSTSMCSHFFLDGLHLPHSALQSRPYNPTCQGDSLPVGTAVSAAQTILKVTPKPPPGVSVDPLRNDGEDLMFLSKHIRRPMGSGHPVPDQGANYYTRSEGKHMRPLLVLLMSQATALAPRKHNPETDGSISVNDPPISLPAEAKYDFSCDDNILPSQRRLAEITELIHTATLCHDDVIDNALTRRANSSANLASGNKMAVLAGDFLLGRASVALARLRDPEAMELMAAVIADSAEGGFMQLRNTVEDESKPVFTDDALNYYLQKAYLKTASLISKSCRCAAVLGRSAPEIIEASYQYGRNLGLAFQLVDDVLDYTATEAELDKPAGANLELGLATAPLLFAWKSNPELGPLIGRKFREQGDVQRAYNIVYRSDGVEKARTLAQDYADKAIAAVSDFPDSEAKSCLIEMCKKAMRRRK